MTSAAPDNRSSDKNAGVMKSFVPLPEDFVPLVSAFTSVISYVYSGYYLHLSLHFLSHSLTTETI